MCLAIVPAWWTAVQGRPADQNSPESSTLRSQPCRAAGSAGAGPRAARLADQGFDPAVDIVELFGRESLRTSAMTGWALLTAC